MAEAFGAILSFLGSVLNGVYKVIPSYGLAIIILTLLVRIVLIPLTLKQIRSMTAMQKLQPELKRLQAKHKGDRQKMNEELMKLYREHGVNPLGGCFPLLMQAPVFIALYSVLRSSIKLVPAVAGVTALTPADLPPKATICTPASSTAASTTLICRVSRTRGGAVEEKAVSVADKGRPLPRYISLCVPKPTVEGDQEVLKSFACRSPVGTGHLPRATSGEFEAGSLGDAIVKDKGTFIGMHLACTPTQAASKTAIRQCTAATGAAGGPSLIAYYALVLLMAGSTYYQQRQMSAQATGPQAKQMQTMGRIMPLFLGFISLNIPAGVIIYWLVSNVWTIGQQSLFLKRPAAGGPSPPGAQSPGGKGKPAKPKR